MKSKIEFEIRQHSNEETYYIAKKGTVNPHRDFKNKTTRLSYAAACGVLRRLIKQLEARDGTL